MTDRHIIEETFDWQGITLSVTFEPDWLGSSETPDFAIAHLAVRSIAPERAPLPFTETGYRSYFLPQGAVEKHGGAVALVRAWLDEAAKDPEWIAGAAARQQLSLF